MCQRDLQMDPQICKKKGKSDLEKVLDSNWILDAFRERPKTGPCGSNAVNSISNSLLAWRPKSRFGGAIVVTFFALCPLPSGASNHTLKSMHKSSKKGSQKCEQSDAKSPKNPPGSPSKTLGDHAASFDIHNGPKITQK